MANLMELEPCLVSASTGIIAFGWSHKTLISRVIHAVAGSGQEKFDMCPEWPVILI